MERGIPQFMLAHLPLPENTRILQTRAFKMQDWLEWIPCAYLPGVVPPDRYKLRQEPGSRGSCEATLVTCTHKQVSARNRVCPILITARAAGKEIGWARPRM